MTFLYLLLFVTESFALQFHFPSNFGGETDFADKVWRKLIEQLSPGMTVGEQPTLKIKIAEEPTCVQRYFECPTTYFGKILALRQPSTALLWVKWHEDAAPFDCDKPEGCIATSDSSVADLTSQTIDWEAKASINGKAGMNTDFPTIISEAERLLLNYGHYKAQLNPDSMISRKTLRAQCSQNHTCYLQTGTLMLSMGGLCDSTPVIACKNLRYYPCELFEDTTELCSQWAEFTQEHCPVGDSEGLWEKCSLTVAVTGSDNRPISFQVFQQKPISGMNSIEEPTAKSPFGELPDGSSGAWVAWNS